MSKIGRYSDSETFSSGAFKSVEIFEHFVRKGVLEDSESESIDESWVRDQSRYYDTDGNFHQSWVSGSDKSSYEDCLLELANEFEYVNRKKHLPIIVPIVEGNPECYVMPRAKTYHEITNKKITDKVIARRSKEIKIALLGRLQKIGVKYLYRDLNYRFESLILLGLRADFTNEKIISNLFWFIAEDAGSGILGDMHNGNIGIYHGNIVSFDLGQVFKGYKTSIRDNYKYRIDYMKWELKRHLNKQQDNLKMSRL